LAALSFPVSNQREDDVETLLAQLERAAEEEAKGLFSVLADLLLERGDARGTLLAIAQAVEHAREAGERETVSRLLEELETKRRPIEGRIQRLCREPSIFWRWGGMVDGLHTRAVRQEELRALLALPELRLLRHLHLGDEVAFAEVAAGVSGLVCSALRDLALGGSLDAAAGSAQLASIWRACPHLSRLELAIEPPGVARLELSELLDLVLTIELSSPEQLQALADASLPSLRYLRLRPHSGSRARSDMGRSLRKATLPALRALAVVGVQIDVDQLCSDLAVADSVGAQLQTLELPHAPSYRGARALVACHARGGELRKVMFPVGAWQERGDEIRSLGKASRGMFVSSLTTDGQVVYRRRDVAPDRRS
jgi:hypothetical protein